MTFLSNFKKIYILVHSTLASMSVVNSVGGSNNSLLWKDKGLEDAGLLHWKVLEQLWLKTQYAVELVQKNPFLR